jgi:nucleoside-diphosphate-sugar epimerase
MKVFVAGASGAIGRRLVPVLRAGGHDVVGMTRTPAKADELRALGADPVVADGLDRDAVIDAVVRAKPDAVIHQMTALTNLSNFRKFDQEFAQTNRLRTTGTDHLLEAARLAGARRFVAQSYGGWTSERTGGPVKTEDDPLDPNPPAAMSQTLDAIKYLERAVLSAGDIEGIVLRYGGFYGPGASDRAGGFVDQVRRRKIPIIGNGAGVWSFIHVDDAATATMLAMTEGKPGVYNVSDDDPAPVAEWLPDLARALDAKPPRRVPVWVGRLFAGDPGVSMFTQIRGISNAKAKRELGWQPRFASWREGFRHGVQGYIPADGEDRRRRIGAHVRHA